MDLVDVPGARSDGRSGLRRALAVIAVVLAAGLHLVVGWFTLTSGLVAPFWAIVVLAAVWVAAVVLLVRTARRSPLAAPLVPVGNGLLLWAALSAGGLWLGWTP